MKLRIKQPSVLLAIFFYAFILPAQPVVTYPNGGETLVAGTAVKITWTGTPLNTLVAIDYTIDNWINTTWISNNYQNPSENSFTWIVPNKPGKKCKIGVFDASTQGDISDNFFTISTSAEISDLNSVNTVDVFPNPTKDIMNIISLSGSPLEFQLYDISGKALSIDVSKIGNGAYRIEKGTLKCGIYILLIRDEKIGTLLQRKIIIEQE